MQVAPIDPKMTTAGEIVDITLVRMNCIVFNNEFLAGQTEILKA